MLDCAEYTKNDDGYQGNGNGNGHHRNGYDRLEGDWLAYYKVGRGFAKRVKSEDKEDFLHDLFLAFARVHAGYQVKGKLLTEGGLVRIAQYELAAYWRKWYYQNQSADCGRCTTRQRQECQANNSFGSRCPKAIKRESLDTLVEDGNGDSTPLHELIADDTADFTARLEAKLILEAYPIRFVQLAYKRYAGYRLTDSEHNYFYRQVKKAQKSLV